MARGFFNTSAKDTHSTFESMYPNGAIASSFQLDPDKFEDMTNWRRAPYVKEQLRNNIDEAEYVVVGFNESLDHTHSAVEWAFCLGTGIVMTNR